jgi:hypothetical protein
MEKPNMLLSRALYYFKKKKRKPTAEKSCCVKRLQSIVNKYDSVPNLRHPAQLDLAVQRTPLHFVGAHQSTVGDSRFIF